jgi:hypothetical protein
MRLRLVIVCSAMALLGLAAGVGAAAASEFEPPEFGRCVKGAPGAEFSKSSCTGIGKPSFAWEPLFGSVPSKTGFIVRSHSVTWETGPGFAMKCSLQDTAGEYASNDTVSFPWLQLRGCDFLNTPGHGRTSCTTPSEPGGEIFTKPLLGTLGLYEQGGEQKVGIELSPQSGEVFAEFTCEAPGGIFTSGTVRGSLILETKDKKMLREGKWKATQTGGVQTPGAFTGGPASQLELSFGEGPYEAVGIKSIIKQINQELIEVNPAF